MKRVLASIVLGLGLLAAHMGPANAAIEMFLRLEGVPGDSQDAQYAGWSVVKSFAFGHAVTSGAGAAGFKPAQFIKELGRTAPVLAGFAATGARIKTATLDYRNSSATFAFFRVILHDVSVRSYEVSGGTNNNLETFELGYARVELYYWPAAGAVPVQMKFDLARNAPY